MDNLRKFNFLENMFNPKTKRIEELAEKNQKRILELENIFDRTTNIYIDWANVIYWQDKLKWHIDLKRLKQFFDSFDTIKSIKFYSGTLAENKESEEFIENVKKFRYNVHTKLVKIMRLSIDVSSIPIDSPALLKNFIKKPLLAKFDLETIEYLNQKLKNLNDRGIKFIEDLKCNFDVEIGRDMLLDYDKNGIDNFILWSGDSDFVDPINQLLEDGKKVMLFATGGRVAIELNQLREKGLLIFDIRKIRNFICWKREIKP